MGALKLCLLFLLQPRAGAGGRLGRQVPCPGSPALWAGFLRGALRPQGATELSKAAPPIAQPSGREEAQGASVLHQMVQRPPLLLSTKLLPSHQIVFFCSLPRRLVFGLRKPYHTKCGFLGSAYFKEVPLGELPVNIKSKWFEGHSGKQEIRG